MATKTQRTISREEFDRRLAANNVRRQNELEANEAEQAQVEQLLAHYEGILDEVEATVLTQEDVFGASALLRTRLQELAIKTAEIAASL